MAETITFTQKIKEELASNEYPSEDRLKALLSAFIRITGGVSFRSKKSVITVKTQSAKTAKFIYTTINKLYGPVVRMHFLQGQNLKKKTTYVITIAQNGDEIIEDLDISFLEGKISKKVVKNDDTISGYLAGAFLACGSCNSPSTSNYHLELVLTSENYAKWMLHLFNRYKAMNVEPKIIKRRGKYVVYLKKSDQIAEFLVMIGATSCCLEFESVRIDRDFSNSTNRLANFDIANMKKTVEAGEKQAEQIRMLDQTLGIENIRNPKARTLCYLRLENESASLSELAEMMSEELNTEISRSHVNHLFRSISNLYDKVCG